MATVDEKTIRASVMRGVLVARFGNTLDRQAQKRIAKLEREIVAIVNEEFGREGARAIKRLQRRVGTAIDQAYADIAAIVLAELNGFADHSREATEEQLKRLLKRISDNVITGGDAFDVKARPILGKTTQDWITDAGAAQSSRILAALTSAADTGIPAAGAVSLLDRVQFKAGRRGLRTAVSAAVTGVEAYTVEEVARDNSDVVIALEWVSALDGNVCLICAGRDGLWRAVGRGKPLPRSVPAERRLSSVAPPYAKPPEHPNCRCVLAPVTIASERLNELIGAGERASVGEAGPRAVDASLSAENFWDAQSDKFLFGTDLGVSRTKLFRSGLSLSQMVDKTGRRLNLDEIKARYPEFWEKAGL